MASKLDTQTQNTTPCSPLFVLSIMNATIACGMAASAGSGPTRCAQRHPYHSHTAQSKGAEMSSDRNPMSLDRDPMSSDRDPMFELRSAAHITQQVRAHQVHRGTHLETQAFGLVRCPCLHNKLKAIPSPLRNSLEHAGFQPGQVLMPTQQAQNYTKSIEELTGTCRLSAWWWPCLLFVLYRDER